MGASMNYQIYFDGDYDKWVVEIRQSSGWATFHQLFANNYEDALYEMVDLCVEVEDTGVW
jgi:hypothetical protein